MSQLQSANSATPRSSYYAPVSQYAVAPAPTVATPRQLIVLLEVSLFLFIAFYQLDIFFLVHRWYIDPSWSHGFLVPLFAGYFVYQSWNRLLTLPIRPKQLLGLSIFTFGCVGHVLFLVFGQYNCAELSMLVCLIGLVLFVLGLDHLRLLWLPICYLLFCIPMPESIYVRLTSPLQGLAAWGAVVILPLFGISAERSGVEILVTRGMQVESLNVAEACSGMRMLVAFFALAVILAYSTTRPIWQKLLLSVCALPIALFCNVLRVALIGFLYVYVNPKYAQGSTHLWLGMLMLIPAMGMQLGLAWILDHLFVDEHNGELI